MIIGQVPFRELREQLRHRGLGLQFGPYEFRLQSPIKQIAEAVSILYADHPWRSPAEFSDFRLYFDPTIELGVRKVVATVNGEIWHTWPRRLTVAALEWICSWCFFRGGGARLAVHAAAATLPGSDRAVVFPGSSGAGKSTLASTLMMSGWGLLSDEIALFDLAECKVTALGRPTILKGESLSMMTDRYCDQAVIGPVGKMRNPSCRIAHLRPLPAAVEICGQSFSPAAFVFPKRLTQGKPILEPVSPGVAFSRLCQFGINYRMLGRAGYDAAINLVRHVPAYQLTYSDAGEAERLLRDCSEIAATVLPATRNPASLATTTKISQHTTLLQTGAATPTVRAASGRGDKTADNPSVVTDPADTVGVNTPLASLVEGLVNPIRLQLLSLSQWDHLIPLANHVQLLPQLAVALSACHGWNRFDPRVQSCLKHQIQQSDFNRNRIQFELRQINQALAAIDCPVVLLKGAAYIQAAFPWAFGRRTADVDLLVSERVLGVVEAALVEAGYEINADLSKADCRYYRRWLHELPPVRHPYRSVEVDLHFRLLPMFDTKSFATESLVDRAVKITGSRFSILDPIDRVLHSAINLARTGEFNRPLRDLWDLRCLIEATPPGIMSPSHSNYRDAQTGYFDWDELISRTHSFRLGYAVGTVLLLASDYIGLTVPPEVCKAMTGHHASRLRRRTLYRLMSTAAIPRGMRMQSRSRRMATWTVAHYPLPRLGTWLDPLTWTKRLSFTRES